MSVKRSTHGGDREETSQLLAGKKEVVAEALEVITRLERAKAAKPR